MNLTSHSTLSLDKVADTNRDGRPQRRKRPLNIVAARLHNEAVPEGAPLFVHEACFGRGRVRDARAIVVTTQAAVRARQRKERSAFARSSTRLHLAVVILLAASLLPVRGNLNGGGTARGGAATGRRNDDWPGQARGTTGRAWGEESRDVHSCWATRRRNRGEASGGGWSERKRSESMRETIELAKADARAVRAAAEDAEAAAAAAAEAEAAWAAAGVGSGGSGGDNAMLFLECEVNGRALRAFVDTGAQVTVMSRACAERCGLASRIDKRFAGRAVGVGFAKILGRIHGTSIRIGNSELTCSFTVIEHGEIDLLVGLDVLRAHRCDISLSRNRLRFLSGGVAREVAFLTRIERDGGRRRRSRRYRRSRRSSYEAEKGDAFSSSPGEGFSPPRPPTAFDGGSGGSDGLHHPPGYRPVGDTSPRVMRELNRGSRGDGMGRIDNVGPASALDASSDGRMTRRKMVGWPPRGGEED